MRVVALYPPGSEEVAVSWVERWSWAAQSSETYRSGIRAGQPKNARGPICDMCTRSKKRDPGELTAKPIRADGGDPAEGKMLVILSYQSYSASVTWATEQIRKEGYKGIIYFDLPVRCGTGDINDSHINKCRSYLAFSIASIKPDLILCAGSLASKALLGRTIYVYQNRFNWQMIDLWGRRVPVVATFSPDDAMNNKFFRESFKEEVNALITNDWYAEPPMSGNAYVCETREDFAIFEAWCNEPDPQTGEPPPFISFDCETSGELFGSDFYISSMAFSRPDRDDCYVFIDAMRNQLARSAIRRILQGTIPKSGQNLRYDLQSVWCDLKFEVAPVYGDIRLEYKLQNSEGKADLQSLGQMIGIGHHKREAEEALFDIKKDLRLGEKLSRGVDKLPSSYRPDAYAIALLPPDITARYVARDAQTSSKVQTWVRRGLQSMAPIYETYQRTVLPAMKELMWVERNGMYVNTSMISICDSYLKEQLDELEGKLREFDVDPNNANSIRAFFEAKNIYSEKWEPTATGLVSTDARSLRLVKSQHEAVAMIIDHRKTAKLLQSYVQTLPAYIRQDARVHPSILLSNNRSARLAMTAPAMQTIPTRGGDAAFLVKSCFTAEGDNTLVVADYKTLEIYFAALLSGDSGMIDILKSGTDYHLETAKKIGMQAWGLTPEEIVKEFEDGFEDHRGAAKTLNFACIAEGELVLTDNGLKPIEEISGCDLLWDGVEWVHHDGVVYMGERDVITYQGLTATEDHNVWTSGGDKLPFGSAASESRELARTGSKAQALPSRFPGDGLLDSTFGGQVPQNLSELCQVLQDVPAVHRRCAEGPNIELSLPKSPEISRPQGCHPGEEVPVNGAEVSAGHSCVEPQLQGARDRGSVRIERSLHHLGPDDIPGHRLQWPRLRSDRQRRTLRAEQPAPRYQVGEPEKPQEKVRVYDILNAGPRHRFTVSGVLVSNCLYGQGPAAIAETLGCSQDAAETLLNSLFRAYPRLKQWINECKAEARDTGYTYSYWGDKVARRRPVLDAGFADRERRGHAERAAFNDRIQSTASDYCLMSVVALGQFFRDNKWPAKVVLTVHDSIIVECRPDITADVVAKMNEIMTGWPSGDLKLKADFKVGPTWGGVSKYKI